MDKNIKGIIKLVEEFDLSEDAPSWERLAASRLDRRNYGT
jgi:hypothetical protein